MTAGVAAKTRNPNMNPHIQGNPRTRLDKMATTTISASPGNKVRRMTNPDSFLSADGSNPSPALSRMMVRATDLKAEAQESSRYLAKSIYGTFFIRIPTMSIPSKSGRCT